MVTPGVYVIAEAGVNHNGDAERARELVDVAAEAGADAVKFQTFHAETLARSDAPKAEYQKETTGGAGSQQDMLRRLELSVSIHEALVRRCAEKGIEFLSTPFDEGSADLLERLGVNRYKIGSGELTNLLLLRHVGAKRKPVILSTGMSTLDEIGAGLEAVRKAGAADVTLLHCVSDYPTRPVDVNLRVMETLQTRFSVPVGFSDHTTGTSVAMAAVALGARIVEKHFTLDRSLPGPDHRMSLEPAALRALVLGIREVEQSLGDGVKRLTVGERSTQVVARRSLVAAMDLAAGTLLEARHVTSKRPGTGLSPMLLDRFVGRRLKQPLLRDALLQEGFFE